MQKLAPNIRIAGITIVLTNLDKATQTATNDLSLVESRRKQELALIEPMRNKAQAVKLSFEVEGRKEKQKLATTAINKSAAQLRTDDFVKGVEKQFGTEKIDAIALRLTTTLPEHW